MILQLRLVGVFISILHLLYGTMNFHTIMTSPRIFAFLLLFCIASTAWAQKKPLDNAVNDVWETIGSSALSDAGRYIYYHVNPQYGDGSLGVKHTANQHIGRIEREAKLLTA